MSDPGRRQGAEPGTSPVADSPALAHAQIITAPLEEEISDAGARWVLAFDASCGRCRTVSHAIGQACDGKVEVLPLAHPEIQCWRQATLGPDAPWAPTLVRLRGEEVDSWTGAAMGLRLTCSLGPRSTLPVKWVRLRLQGCL